MISRVFAAVLLAGGIAIPAPAQDTAPTPDVTAVTVGGPTALTTGYRVRGMSPSDGNAAAQVALTIAPDSGIHSGTWASNLSGRGTVGGADRTGFAEPCVTLTGATGPTTLTAAL